MVPALVAEAPASPGVYELATLVRTVVFIGSASESLSEALNQHMSQPATLHPHFGRLYFRTAALDDPEHGQSALLDEYRARHAGLLPAAQTSEPPAPVPARRHLKAV